jgi:tetratricopeptide (TPR) repeat protein
VLWGLGTPAERALRPARYRLRSLLAIAAAPSVLALAWIGWHADLDRDIATVQTAALAEPDRVELLCVAAIARHPAEPWFPLFAAVDRVRHHQPDAALHYLNRALALDPKAWRPHQIVAEALLQRGRRRQAMLEFRFSYVASQYDDLVLYAPLAAGVRFGTGLELVGGDDVEALAHLADFLTRVNRDADAEAAARHLGELRPADPRGHRVLALVAARHGRFAEALTETAALGDEPEVVLMRVGALDGLGRAAEADALLDRRFAAAPDATLAFALAERALAAHRAPAALAALDAAPQKALTVEQLGRLHVLHGRALEQLGRTRESILDFVQATRFDPSEANRLVLGDAYERAGILRAALLEYRALARSSPKVSPELQARLSRVERALGAGVTISGSAKLPRIALPDSPFDDGDDGSDEEGDDPGKPPP